MTVREGDEQPVVINCHAGCSAADVAAAIGLDLADLCREDRRRGDGDETRRRECGKRGSVASRQPKREPDRFATADAALAELARRHGEPDRMWVYRDGAGEPVGHVVRWDARGDRRKSVRPVARIGDAWVIEMMPESRPLYRLPELAALAPGSRVLVCEGEPAADAAVACGFAATTSAGGSKAARKSDWTALGGLDVVAVPDRDDPGEHYADDVRRAAIRAGARSVRTIRLADHWPALPTGGDLVDALEAEGGDVDAMRAAVDALVAAAEDESPQPDATARPGYQPFPVDALPEPVREYVVAGAAAIGCDRSYVAAPLLAALASVIGNARVLRLKRSWPVPSIAWACVVGESGTAKSPALELALRPFKRRQADAMRAHELDARIWADDHARWECERDAWKARTRKGESAGDPPPEPERPTCPRTITDDATLEALVALLDENPRGLLLARDELAGWLGSFDAYRGGRGGDAARWLEVFDGRSVIVDRKSAGTIHVPRAAVSIAGGIQPGTLRRALGDRHRENGLLARLLVAMPPRKPKRWTDADVPARLEAAMDRLVEGLHALAADEDYDGEQRPRDVALAPDALARFKRFVNEHGRETDDRTGDEAAAWSKLEGYAARLALVLHCCRVAAGDPTVADPDEADLAAIEAGIVLVRWFGREAERVYDALAGDDADDERRQLVEWIAGRDGSVTARDLARGPRQFGRDTARAETLLADLVEAGIGRWEDPKPGQAGGRPSRQFVLHGSPGDGGDGDETPDAGAAAGGSGTVATSPPADDGWGRM